MIAGLSGRTAPSSTFQAANVIALNRLVTDPREYHVAAAIEKFNAEHPH